jgi:hypothetical protein
MKDRILCAAFTGLIYLAMGLLLIREWFRLIIEETEKPTS